MKQKKIFSGRIEKLKKDKGVAILSKESGVSVRSLQRYVKMTSEPSLSNLVDLAKAADTTVAWLIGEVDDKNWKPGEIAATISPGDKKITLADQLPVNRVIPLKMIVEWMNETFQGEIGEEQAMHFYDDLKRNYPSFREFMEKKAKSSGHLDGPQENVSDGTDG